MCESVQFSMPVHCAGCCSGCFVVHYIKIYLYIVDIQRVKENKTSRERKRDREHERQGKEEGELNASDPTKTPSTTEAIQTIFCDILRYDCMLAQRCSLLHSALTSSIHHINNHTYIIILCRGAYSEYFKFTVATKVFGMHIT